MPPSSERDRKQDRRTNGRNPKSLYAPPATVESLTTDYKSTEWQKLTSILAAAGRRLLGCVSCCSPACHPPPTRTRKTSPAGRLTEKVDLTWSILLFLVLYSTTMIFSFPSLSAGFCEGWSTPVLCKRHAHKDERHMQKFWLMQRARKNPNNTFGRYTITWKGASQFAECWTIYKTLSPLDLGPVFPQQINLPLI